MRAQGKICGRRLLALTIILGLLAQAASGQDVPNTDVQNPLRTDIRRRPTTSLPPATATPRPAPTSQYTFAPRPKTRPPEMVLGQSPLESAPRPTPFDHPEPLAADLRANLPAAPIPATIAVQAAPSLALDQTKNSQTRLAIACWASESQRSVASPEAARWSLNRDAPVVVRGDDPPDAIAPIRIAPLTPLADPFEATRARSRGSSLRITFHDFPDSAVAHRPIRLQAAPSGSLRFKDAPVQTAQ